MSYPHPKNLLLSSVEHSFIIRSTQVAVTMEKSWQWLMLKSTFSDGQVWPYKVEFVADGASHKDYFQKGDFTNHHGPFLTAAGKVSKVDEMKYRRLDYFYGSYVVSFRVMRPVALEFWLREVEGGVEIKLSLDYQVLPMLSGLFDKVLAYFWRRFEKWMRSSIESTRAS